MANIERKIQIQSVIYGNEKQSLYRAIKALVQAVKVYKKRGNLISAQLVYGDASPEKIFNEEDIDYIKEITADEIEFAYKYFGFNSGTAKGHNLMASEADGEYILIMNPDVILETSALVHMFDAFDQDEKIAMVEARQTPLEHAKEYDQKTGETEWASTACTIFRKKAYDEIGGFDADTFFLYCDDLDFSWRLRLAGYKIVYVPNAVVYHAKTLTTDACWKPTGAEVYYSAEAALLLAYKWSNFDRVKHLKKVFENVGGEAEKKAVNEFVKRESENKLPDCIDPDHKIARFLDDDYCEMRFKIG
ncbi:dTDP-Rha:alpha-D-GlcNAc-pyrophosphate polyprenol%2C alpha-3-L-rhamnosyltransferase [uncultured Clostridium sp.]|uniref:Glycosyltransferase n=1 Tax=Muricoprocola aceti TaxID=2981772 RepID=A0ABT2SPP2_9FIRM|nr:glycosyltransferase [Muricoprocola aceti]MCU6726491.1 glycosyltransferase [Muricoprocola aceti]SCH92286.1 dTDP-Rha:alpha-D-GlcNAc-pyrophosphate polyprenol%2C alpha-3-L-rhamnosyltransferase [uncultured Clostridium sp.]